VADKDIGVIDELFVDDGLGIRAKFRNGIEFPSKR
jgi:hypothetical protein